MPIGVETRTLDALPATSADVAGVVKTIVQIEPKPGSSTLVCDCRSMQGGSSGIFGSLGGKT